MIMMMIIIIMIIIIIIITTLIMMMMMMMMIKLTKAKPLSIKNKRRSRLRLLKMCNKKEKYQKGFSTKKYDTSSSSKRTARSNPNKLFLAVILQENQKSIMLY